MKNLYLEIEDKSDCTYETFINSIKTCIKKNIDFEIKAKNYSTVAGSFMVVSKTDNPAYTSLCDASGSHKSLKIKPVALFTEQELSIQNLDKTNGDFKYIKIKFDETDISQKFFINSIKTCIKRNIDFEISTKTLNAKVISLVVVSKTDNPAYTSLCDASGSHKSLKIKPVAFLTAEELKQKINLFTSTASEKVTEPYVNLRDHDSLTKCWNKKAFREELQFTNESDLSIIYADIDGLKLINDKKGHEAGDILISTVASILNKHFPDCVYRLEDDDFAIILHGYKAKDVVNKLNCCKLDMIRKTNTDTNGIFYSASFGVAVQDGESLYEELAELSEIRLKVDKIAFRSGKRSGVVLNTEYFSKKSTEARDSQD